MKFIPGLTPQHTTESAYWFVFCGDELLVTKKGDTVNIPLDLDLNDLQIPLLREQYLGTLDGKPCYTADLAQGIATPAGIALLGLRKLFGLVEDELFNLAGRARQILEWDKTHQFCGQCGSPTDNKVEERAKVCPRCGFISYPRLSPAIIVAITKGTEILLARGNRFAIPMYSVLAGFVEPGETLEECVRREIKEEVGIEVKNIRYFGSQPWPFPHSLMVGFTADYAGGEIKLDPSEIMDAAWFTKDNLPLLPDKISIARKLIDWFICQN